MTVVRDSRGRLVYRAVNHLPAAHQVVVYRDVSAPDLAATLRVLAAEQQITIDERVLTSLSNLVLN